MTHFFTPFAFLRLAIRRLTAHFGLTLAALSGLVAAATIAVSIPLYADASYSRVLQRSLDEKQGREARPPFAFMFRYVGAWHGALEWEDFGPLDTYITRQVPGALGLPITLTVRHFRTEPLRLYPADEAIYADRRQPLAWFGIGFISDLGGHIDLLEGQMPGAAGPEGPVEVLVSLVKAEELGLQTGEDYILFDPSTTQTRVPVRISGIWKAKDEEDPFWFYDPAGLSDVLLASEESYSGYIASNIKEEGYLGLWYIVADGSGVTSDEVGALLGRIGGIQGRVISLMPKAGLDVSPVDTLSEYRRLARQLSISLYTFSVPVLGLILAFIGLVAGLSVERRRNEIAILRSRGASITQVIILSIVEGAVLAALALAIAVPLGREVAALIAKTRTFLEFIPGPNVNINLSVTALRIGLAAVIVAVVALLLPTFGASRHTIVTYKLERARALRAPWWQRAWLDMLLLIPAGYGAYLLRRQGGLGGDPFGNPLLIAVPAFFVLALSLVVLRLLPLLMNILAAVLAWLPGVSALFATRHLARSSRFFTGPLMLLILTLSLAIYTASLALTLDYNLWESSHYKVGSDMHLVELGESTETSAGAGMLPVPTPAPAPGEEEEVGPRWLFLPVSEHLKAPGVRAAARVADFKASTDLAGQYIDGIFRGLDRVDFTRVAYWRKDLAPASLGALMNALAIHRDGVLVPRSLLGQLGLQIGDRLPLRVTLFGETHNINFTIAGYFDLFPRWDPTDGPLFVGDLDYLYENAGGLFPYDVWLSTDPSAKPAEIVQAVSDLRLHVFTSEDRFSIVAAEQARPQRQGTLGLLSIGFVAAGLLTVLAFLFYALFSFQRRFIELGVLRAMGLSIPQMAALLGWEMVLLLGSGTAAGTALGVWASHLFIPYLQSGPAYPPFRVVIAWDAIGQFYILFGILFLVALAVLVPMLVRMRIFQAVKMGEAG